MGISETVFTFIASAHESVVIISPEPTSLTDAYSLLKVLKGKGIQKGLYALVNMVLSYEDSVKIFNRFNSTTKKFLGTELKYLGYIMTDQIIVASVIQQKPVMILNPESTPGHCFTSIAGKFQTDFKFFENTRFSENLHRVTALKGEGKERVAGEKSAVKLKEGAFTTPEDVKKGYGKSFGKGEDPGTVIVRLIEEGGLSLDKASEYVRKIEEACINRFRKSPVDIKNSLYSSLDLSGFSESRIREFALMLEALYAKRYQKQLFDLEDILIRLIEEGEGSEERLKQMIGNLRNRYRTSFKKSELSVEEFLADYLNADDLTKDDFENIAGIIQSACMEKFGKSFRLITEDMHEEVLEAFRSIKERDVTINTLLQQVTRQSQSRATLSQTLNEKRSDSGFE
ncbi:MAG: MinD/ParA family protein [Nitrospinota bacterium]